MLSCHLFQNYQDVYCQEHLLNSVSQVTAQVNKRNFKVDTIEAGLKNIYPKL